MKNGKITNAASAEQSADLAFRQREAEADASELLTKIAQETIPREAHPAVDARSDIRNAGTGGSRCLLALEDVTAAGEKCWVDVARTIAQGLRGTAVSSEGTAMSIYFGNAALFRKLCVFFWF